MNGSISLQHRLNVQKEDTPHNSNTPYQHIQLRPVGPCLVSSTQLKASWAGPEEKIHSIPLDWQPCSYVMWPVVCVLVSALCYYRGKQHASWGLRANTLSLYISNMALSLTCSRKEIENSAQPNFQADFEQENITFVGKNHLYLMSHANINIY